MDSSKKIKILNSVHLRRVMKTTLADEFEISTKTVQRISKFDIGEKFEKKKYDSSLRFFLSENHLLLIREFLERYPYSTADDIIHLVDIPTVDRTTLGRFLKKHKIRTLVAIKKTGLDEDERNARKNFCNYYLHELGWTTENVENLICTDESMFWSLPGRQLIKTNKQRTDPSLYNLAPIRQVKINVYGYITCDHFELFRISNSFDSAEFYDLMVTGILPSGQLSDPRI